MSIIVTPSLNSTETIQVATPFSYSFTYSTPIYASDPPGAYSWNGGTICNVNSNSVILTHAQNNATASGSGSVYTVSNMTPTTDVLECVLPILVNGFSLNSGSYITFGGANPLYIIGGPPNQNTSPPTTGHFASFGSLGPFAYGFDGASNDSLKYIPLNGSPVSSFKVVLARPNITYTSVTCSLSGFTMTVTDLIQGSGQVNVGMVFPVQGGAGGLTRAFTVTAFGSGFGGVGTYTFTPNDAGGGITLGSSTLTSTVVGGSGDVVLSASMTPSSGTAQFVISTAITYTAPT